MQNISLMSFAAHLAINIFFKIKNKIFRLNRSGTVLLWLKVPRANIAFSFLLISTIIGLNMAQFSNLIHSNANTGSGYRQLVSLLECQSVLAQSAIPPYTFNAVPKNIPAANMCDISDYRPNAACTAIAANNTGFRSTTITQNGDLWEAARQLITDYMEENPCNNREVSQTEYCNGMLSKKIDEIIVRLLKENNFPENKNLSEPVRPGQRVWLGVSGTLWIDR